MTIVFADQFANTIKDMPLRMAVRETVSALCVAAFDISKICARGPLEENIGAETGQANADGDSQKALDVRSDELVTQALRTASVAYYASEERDDIIPLDKNGLVAVASDPLDGSSNIDTNVSIGTIFSIYPVGADERSSFFRPGHEQIAGGFFVYGPQTTLVITTGDGTALYVLNRACESFELAIPKMSISGDSTEFAINASNMAHWQQDVQRYIKDCIKGEGGPLGRKYNMRWVGSLVADAYRVLVRGGIFLYPSDDRPGYEAGRLRLLYEAAPVAFVIEQAGGVATDGDQRILDIKLATLHQRVPFIFGSPAPVRKLAHYNEKT